MLRQPPERTEYDETTGKTTRYIYVAGREIKWLHPVELKNAIAIIDDGESLMRRFIAMDIETKPTHDDRMRCFARWVMAMEDTARAEKALEQADN